MNHLMLVDVMKSYSTHCKCCQNPFKQGSSYITNVHMLMVSYNCDCEKLDINIMIMKKNHNGSHRSYISPHP